MDKIMNIQSKMVQQLVILFAIALSCIAVYFSYQSNYILTYNDAASHLNIARRVVDSITPGFAQIGTVWLPLPHIFMLVFAWNNTLWHTGLAGSIISMIAYITGAIYIHKLINLLISKPIAGAIGTLVFLLNPNLLYLQTTPMTEPLLLTSIIIAIYYAAKYLHTNTINYLILSGVFVTAATLVRYDGWFLYMFLAALLPVFVYFIRGLKRAESTLMLFLTAGGFGIFLWFLWNITIFGDAFYFITGPYSAAAQQKVLKQVGQLPTQGNIFLASFYYVWAIIENNGFYITIAALLASFFVPLMLKQKRHMLVLLAVLSPIMFNVIALYLGQSAINIPEAPQNPGLFNIRYGLMALPWIAVVLGVISSNKYARILVVALIYLQSYIFIQQGIPITLIDGMNGLENTYYTVEASQWLANNYHGGYILTSLASHDAFVARTGLPMKYYIHEGTRDYWNNALQNPSLPAGPKQVNITYIAVLSFPPDTVYKALRNNPSFYLNYKLVHKYKEFEIYERIR
jgi:hypothetical protein